MRLKLTHRPSLGGPRVIHPQQVQDAVKHEVLELSGKRDATLQRLGVGALDRDQHVTEARSTEPRSKTFARREGQHIGRLGQPAEAPRDCGDL